VLAYTNSQPRDNTVLFFSLVDFNDDVCLPEDVLVLRLPP
jgi:hypothetical protein